jgi:Na+-transporting NADH:ubiquinone oxidoreductase subunit C
MPALSTDLGDDDIAKIGRRAHYAEVYLVRRRGGRLDKVILPVHGYGLWSTLYGFVALESDGNTIAGWASTSTARRRARRRGGQPALEGAVAGQAGYRDGDVEISVCSRARGSAGPVRDWHVDGSPGPR